MLSAFVIAITILASLGAVLGACMAFERKAAIPAFLWTLATPIVYIGGLTVLGVIA